MKSFNKILLIRLISVSCFLLCITFHAFSHGDLHERILVVTQEIKISPDSAFLYFKRGKLYYQHEDYNSSLNDILSSSQLGYQSVALDLLFSKVYRQLEEYELALKYIDKVLSIDRYRVTALRLKGHIYMDRSQYKNAATNFEMVITHSKKTFPINYLEASRAWEMYGGIEGKGKSISSIESGIQHIGSNILLFTRLVVLGLQYNIEYLALENQNRIIHLSFRKEVPLFHRGLIYKKYGDVQCAKDDFIYALQLIENLAPSKRNLMSINKLKNSINNEL